MYRRLLISLDGSALSEKAIPHALEIARAFDGELHLIRVVSLSFTDNPPEAGVTTAAAIEKEEATAYLASISGQLEADGLHSLAVVRTGDVADEILAYAVTAEIDLMVMTTHGRSGLGRWVYGSIADRVLRRAETPVLLIRAGE